MNNKPPEIKLVSDHALIAQSAKKHERCKFVVIGEIREETESQVHRVIIAIWHEKAVHEIVAQSLLSKVNAKKGRRRYLLGAGFFDPNNPTDLFYGSDSCVGSFGYDSPRGVKCQFPFKEGELKVFLGDEVYRELAEKPGWRASDFNALLLYVGQAIREAIKPLLVA